MCLHFLLVFANFVCECWTESAALVVPVKKHHPHTRHNNNLILGRLIFAHQIFMTVVVLDSLGHPKKMHVHGAQQHFNVVPACAA